MLIEINSWSAVFLDIPAGNAIVTLYHFLKTQKRSFATCYSYAHDGIPAKEGGHGVAYIWIPHVEKKEVYEILSQAGIEISTVNMKNIK